MTEVQLPPHLSKSDIDRLNAGRHDAPFDKLGCHDIDGIRWLVVCLPDATGICAKIGRNKVNLVRLDGAVFGAKIPTGKVTLTASNADGHSWSFSDPYSFGPVLSDVDAYLIGEGTHKRLWDALGAHVITHEKTKGTHFAVWAPNAQSVSVIGSFNNWHSARSLMRPVGHTGVWEIFIPEVSEGDTYKYRIIGADGAEHFKADPVGFGAQHPPEQASVVRNIKGYEWSDAKWMDRRIIANRRDEPISIYEVHLGSWRRRYDEGGRPLSYKELAVELIDYVKDLGFTHIEFMPVSEFPFDGSWGYQPVGMYAPTTRFGPPNEFRDLVNASHEAGLGVLLDWVPGHFPADAHGLGHFDGTSLYEHADPREGFHQDWNTLIYNYGRTEVKNYLVANALYWLEEYHVDGLRVDAVASMLYRDYSRKEGEWVPNKDGGRENYEAIDFLQSVNTESYAANHGIMTVAEESTSFPQVTGAVHNGGLGFGYKWNMGWMNDTLSYMERDPIYRKHHHHQMTHGISYAFSENFILPISHDEVVHGKGSMLHKMPGNIWEQFANLRAYYGFMWTHPGKKLLFMGCEFGQPEEWNHNIQLDWDASHRAPHKGVQDLIRDLNRVYRSTPSLYAKDCESDGFAWVNGGDTENSTISFLRYGNEGDAPTLSVGNFTPVERSSYRVGVPEAGFWQEIINTDAECYGGGNRGNFGGVEAQEVPHDGYPYSIEITVPPLATVIFRVKR